MHENFLQKVFVDFICRHSLLRVFKARQTYGLTPQKSTKNTSKKVRSWLKPNCFRGLVEVQTLRPIIS